MPSGQIFPLLIEPFEGSDFTRERIGCCVLIPIPHFRKAPNLVSCTDMANLLEMEISKLPLGHQNLSFQFALYFWPLELSCIWVSGWEEFTYTFQRMLILPSVEYLDILQQKASLGDISTAILPEREFWFISSTFSMLFPKHWGKYHLVDGKLCQILLNK